MFKLCEVLGSGEGFEANLLFFCYEVKDRQLQKISHARNIMVQEAIARRIPNSCPIPAIEAANLLHTVISGAAMQWATCGEGRLDSYAQKRVLLALSGLLSH